MAVSLLEELTKIQRKQSWKDRALLRVITEYLEYTLSETQVGWLIDNIKFVADEDNKRLQECMERHNAVSN